MNFFGHKGLHKDTQLWMIETQAGLELHLGLYGDKE